MAPARLVRLAVALGAAALPACSSSTDSSGVASLAVTPDPIFLVRQDSVQLSVSALDADGHLVVGVSVSFASTDTTIATVSNLGLVRSTGPAGTATIRVQGGGVTKLVPLTVTQVPVGVSLAPSDTSIGLGRSVPYRARVVDANGDSIPGQSITFQSSDTSRVTISGTGVATSIDGAGTVFISARNGPRIAFATLRIRDTTITLAPSDTSIRQGESAQYRATVLDSEGNPVPSPTVTFASSDTSRVTISGTGLATAIGDAGTVVITARHGPRSATATLTVRDTSIVARLPLDGYPYGVAVLPSGIAYVTRVLANAVERLDLATPAFTASIPVGTWPSGVAFNAAGTKAYVANQGSGNVGIIDVATATQTGVIPVRGNPLPVVVSGDGNTLLVTGNNANWLYKVDIPSATIVDSLAVPATSHHLLRHPNDTLVYVATRDGGSALEVNWRAMTVARTFTLGGRTQGMVLAPDNQELYVADEVGGVLQVVNLATGGTAATVPLGGGGHHVGLSADGTKLYVGLVFDGKVQVINRASRTITATIATGGAPRQIGVDAARNRMFVANESGWVDILR